MYLYLLLVFLTGCECQTQTSIPATSLPVEDEIGTVQSSEEDITRLKDSLHQSNSFIKEWLLAEEGNLHSEHQTYDGWYNNPWEPSRGSSDTPLIRLLPNAYKDRVHSPNNKTRANPFIVSDAIMSELAQCPSYNESYSKTGKNALMVFFGQFVVEEIVNARTPSCPPQYFDIHIPPNHHFRKSGLKVMPFIRTKFDKKSGKSSNNPLRQLNAATSWIDGSVIYGTSRSKANTLRSFKNGCLASSDPEGLFPVLNDGYLKYLLPSENHETAFRKKNSFRVGNPLAHENPFLLVFHIIFFRYHNHLASGFCKKFDDWDDERCFHEARKWVIATLQHIIMDEWLPSFLNENIDEYERYDPSIDPSISNAFQAAAMRFGHTLVPSAVYKRKFPNDCENDLIRLCGSYYNAKDIIMNNSIESLILGMAFQAAEKEDIIISDDLRRYMHGPPEFTRTDLMAVNIQRGRDHGLPGFGVARKFMKPRDDNSNFDFNKMASISDPAYENIIKNTLKKFYSSMDDVDLWVGGLLESRNDLGPVFKAIVMEQFLRIRNADRFWFEHKQNGLFTESEIAKIKLTSMFDIIILTTQKIETDELQRKIFHLPPTDAYPRNLRCTSTMMQYNCQLKGHAKTCYALPPVKGDVLKCPLFKDVSICQHFLPQSYDYFTGSGGMYVLSFVALFLFIVSCIIALILLVRQRKKESSLLNQSIKKQRKENFEENSCLVTEWIGRKEGTREIVIHFLAERKLLNLTLIKMQLLRSIDMRHVQLVELHVGTGSHIFYILIRIKREYDIVLQFEAEEDKSIFIEKLETFLGNIGVGRQRYESHAKQLLKSAYTKADRQEQLETFFRAVFAQAFAIKHEQEDLLKIDNSQIKEIVKVELTPYEFAEALSLRSDAIFVQQMFELIDADGNGYISFREFLNVIIIFAKGSAEDKTKLMFDIYDVDRSGKLSRDEFSGMIRSLLELVNQSLSSEQLDDLITTMFHSAGLENKQEMSFDDFSRLLADHREELGYVQLSFNIGDDGFQAAPPASRKSIAIRAQETVLRAYSVFGEQNLSKPERAKSYIRVETKPMHYEADPTKQKVNAVIRFVENYQLHIFWTILYTLFILGIFIEKSYFYSVEAEHTGLRRVAGYGVTISRGGASSLMFAFSTILLTMCRNTITILRETFFHKYVPFDAAISFHKYIGFWAIIFTLLHVIGHGINFYHISTQTVADLQCLFSNFHIDPQKPPKFPYWLFQTITGITGVFLVVIIILIYVFAIQYSRRYVFNAFWKTHNLYPILYILMILHGIGGIIQAPIFYYFFLGPCVLFTLDRLVSVSRKKVEISVVKAELLPSSVTYLEFKRPANFEYRSGQWVRIACMPLNKNEYHPFTISSAPHEENLMLHIRAVGPWTTNLRKVYDPNNLQQHAYPKIYLDGPYGEGHQDWFRYDVSVLVGGGIGITPFASILKDVVFKSSMKNRIFCKKLYFIWVTRSQKQFEWMVDIIREVEETDKRGFVNVHIFITQFYQKFDLRTTMLYICERHFQKVCGKSLFTGLKSTTHFGRPDFKVFFDSLRQEHSDVSKIAVFSCGPPLMTKGVQTSCEELNKHEGAIFVHHYENF